MYDFKAVPRVRVSAIFDKICLNRVFLQLHYFIKQNDYAIE